MTDRAYHDALDDRMDELAADARRAEQKVRHALARVRKIDDLAKRARGAALVADIEMVAARLEFADFCQGAGQGLAL